MNARTDTARRCLRHSLAVGSAYALQRDLGALGLLLLRRPSAAC